mmetsp:Transcript_36788/g.84724  ORF Transcript_36788/g.84724 Transcript_36788/m.84724 type:complete len:759 (+) Transcript_36788:175-2451(+)
MVFGSSNRSKSEPAAGANHNGKVNVRDDPFAIREWPPLHNDPFLSHSMPEGKRAPKGQVTVVEDPLLVGVQTKEGTKGFMNDAFQLENDPFMTHNNPANNVREPSRGAKRIVHKEKKKKEEKYKPKTAVLREDPFLNHGKAAKYEHLATDPFMNYEYKKYKQLADDDVDDNKKRYGPDGQLLCETDARMQKDASGKLVPISIAHSNRQELEKGWYRAETNRLDPTHLSEFGNPKPHVAEYPDMPPWSRITQLSPVQGWHADVFDYTQREATHLGRVYPGQLDNGYFVEALNAITLRPKLARLFFYSYDAHRAIYIVQLFINGTWVRVEVDDHVPPAFNFLHGADRFQGMLCCRSEHFPHVLWPSLVEKAYATVNTIRAGGPAQDLGGWQALGGGGRVESALADLTGGVAGRFSTRDVTPDRLFLYLYELQRDVLFVCRPMPARVAKFGVGFNPCVPHAVNRAAPYEGQCYVQVFCGGPCVDDGGFQELTVPDALVRMFPEKLQDGFYWLSIYDFHKYFETIIECRLVNSPDVGIVGMPPSRLPRAMAPPLPIPMGHPQGAVFAQPTLFYEQVFATEAVVTWQNCPEFGVQVPGGGGACEIVACVSQTDKRDVHFSEDRIGDAPVLLKVYEQMGHNVYSADMVTRSNWIPIRESMVAFRCEKGGTFKIVCELPQGFSAKRLIFRCYSSLQGAVASASVALQRHTLVASDLPPGAEAWTLVGCTQEDRLARLASPQPFNEEADRMLPPEMWKSREDCSIM